MTGHGRSRLAATSTNVPDSADDGVQVKKARLDVAEVASPTDGRPASPTPEDISQLALVYHRRSIEASAGKDFTMALRHARKCLLLCPDKPLYLAGAARCFHASGYGDKAAQALRSARKILSATDSPPTEEVQMVDSAWRLIFPFDGFPDELLAEILDHLYSTTPLDNPLIATQICSSWRRLALRQSSLWRDTSIFPSRPKLYFSSRRERLFGACSEGSERLPAILRLCDERSNHSIRTIRMPAESCLIGLEEVLKLAWINRDSLVEFELSSSTHAICQCISKRLFDYRRLITEVLERQFQLLAAAPLLDTISVYLSPTRLPKEHWAMLGRQIQDRQKAPTVVRLILPCATEEELHFIEILKPVLGAARALAIDANGPMSMAASWKAAFFCSRTVEKLELPLELSSRDLLLLDGALESACRFPFLSELTLKSKLIDTTDLGPIPAPAHRLRLPALRTLDMDVRALTAFEMPFLEAAVLHVLCPEDASTLATSIRTWEHLEYLTIDIEEVFTGGPISVRRIAEVLCTLLADSSQVTPACPKLSSIRLTCRTAATPRESPEAYAQRLRSCSREQWEALPSLGSSIFRLEEKRRKLCQNFNDSRAVPSTLAQSSGAFNRGVQRAQEHAPEPEPSLHSPSYVPFDEIILEGWYVDPHLWSAFTANSPCEVTCLPDPLRMNKKLYNVPRKPSKGEKRVYAW